MIVRVGNIILRVEIGGSKSLRLEREIRGTFSGFIAPSTAPFTPWDASLKIFVLPDIHLDGILLDEEKTALKAMLERIQQRFPYAKFPYRWVTGFHRNGSKAAPRPGTLPRPFISRALLDRFSLVPLRQCLLALNHDDHQAVALVRGGDTTVLMNAVILAIQATLCMLAPDKKAVMLHGASAEIKGAGYLFLGVSGSGKSTMAGNFPREDVFSDESTLCSLDHGMPFIAPTPFTQNGKGSGMPDPAPLKKIFFLKKDKENFSAAVSPGTAMAKILRNHIHFFSFLRNQEALEAFQAVEGMVRNVPAFVLHSKPGFDPLPFLEETAYERKKAL